MMDYITTFKELHKHIGEVCEFGYAYSIPSSSDYESQDEFSKHNPDWSIGARMRGRLGVQYSGIGKTPVYLFDRPVIYLLSGKNQALENAHIFNEKNLEKRRLFILSEDEALTPPVISVTMAS